MTNATKTKVCSECDNDGYYVVYNAYDLDYSEVVPCTCDKGILISLTPTSEAPN